MKKMNSYLYIKPFQCFLKSFQIKYINYYIILYSIYVA